MLLFANFQHCHVICAAALQDQNHFWLSVPHIHSVAPLAVHFQRYCLDLNLLEGASDDIPIVLHDSVY